MMGRRSSEALQARQQPDFAGKLASYVEAEEEVPSLLKADDYKYFAFQIGRRDRPLHGVPARGAGGAPNTSRARRSEGLKDYTPFKEAASAHPRGASRRSCLGASWTRRNGPPSTPWGRPRAWCSIAPTRDGAGSTSRRSSPWTSTSFADVSLDLRNRTALWPTRTRSSSRSAADQRRQMGRTRTPAACHRYQTPIAA